jgi:aminotransferase
VLAPAVLTAAIRMGHYCRSVGAPAPLLEGVAVALDGLPPAFYEGLAAMYRGKRDLLHSALVEAGFRCLPPEGAYYILADFTGLGPAATGRPPLDDTAFAVWLSREVGVTPVPGSSFYRDGGGGSLVRYVFCKTEEILAEAARRLRGLHGSRASAADAGARAAEPAIESGLQR